MYKIYFKQAIQMLKQNKFISIITITGTALAIMMIMVIIVTETIKNKSIAPESNRDRTFYIKSYIKEDKVNQGMWASNIPYDIYKDFLSGLKTPEYTSALKTTWDDGRFMIKKYQSEERELSNVKLVDASYWKIMAFSFIEGKPFTQEDFESEMRNAVITEDLAKKVFGNENPIGKNIEIDFHDFKVTGVIKDVPQTFAYAYAEAFIPYTSKKGYQQGSYILMFLLKDKNDVTALDKEIRDAEKKYTTVNRDYELTLWGPYNHRQALFQSYSNHGSDEKRANRKIIFIFTVLLLIPAVNLSSFSMSRIKRRSEEIGIRKAFGAKKYVILIQVLFENFITSLIGGLLGLILSYATVFWFKEWLLEIESGSSIPLGALISFPVFIGVFLVCFALNLISAAIPAYRAAKMNIIDSINNKNE